MEKILTVLLFLMLNNKADSQVTEEWVSRYNGTGNLGDGAWSTAVDGSGNVYVTGYSVGNGTGDDYLTIKYNSSGIQLWTARYNGPGNNTDQAYQIKIDDLGNVYVTGFSRSGVNSITDDYATIKYNSAGVLQWVSRYNGPAGNSDIAYNLELDNSGNVYVTGSSTGSGTSYDYATIKYNSSGDSLWVKRYNGPGNSLDEAYRIAVSDSGNVYVTGYSRSGSSAGTEDYATIKYNSSGDSLWVKRYNNGANDVAYSIAVDDSGNVFVTGFVWNGFSGADCMTVKYNSSGVQQWLSVLVANGTGAGYSVALDNSGNLIAAGTSYGSGSNPNFVTVKYRSDGNLLWQKFYNGPGDSDDTALQSKLDDSNNIYVTGYSKSGSSAGTEDYATIKYNPSGDSLWVQRYNGPGNGADIPRSIAVDELGNVYVTGKSFGSGTGDDYATIKYSQTGSVNTLYLTAFIEGFYNSISNNKVIDTLKVFLRNSSSPYNAIDSSIKIFSSAGTGTFLFSNAANGINYYIAVRHRNSIETWSSSVIQFTSGVMNFNFATVISQAFGDNMKLVDLSPIRYGFFSADVNQDGTVDLADGSLIDNDAFNFVEGYVPSDVNGDDVVDLADAVFADNNAFNFVSKITP